MYPTFGKCATRSMSEPPLNVPHDLCQSVPRLVAAVCHKVAPITE